MTILGLKPDHDGAGAIIRGGVLERVVEAEKDSRPRHSFFKSYDLFALLAQLEELPDVVAIGGWNHDGTTARAPFDMDGCFSYEGLSAIGFRKYRIAGKEITLFGSSHERSHLACAYALSPLPRGTPCYALVWEGRFGRFYRIDEKFNITLIGEPLSWPGFRYKYLYYMANEAQRAPWGPDFASGPGKLMALAAYGREAQLDQEGAELMEILFSARMEYIMSTPGIAKVNLPIRTVYKDIGVESERFKHLARAFSDELFRRFLRFAEARLTEKLPLIIAGGCGLNCEWNAGWERSGLFSSVFIPPCANDSGAAIGTAADAYIALTGETRVQWSIYAGDCLIEDLPEWTGFSRSPLDVERLAESLAHGKIVAWARGRCEVGPRALGNRSLLAAPFEKETTDRLNWIKQREPFRPIAPVCLEEDMALHFEGSQVSRYMLQFHRVKDERLKAITHVDGTARVQSVAATDNPDLYELLRAFKRKTGVGVLCNTSLNLKGKGFINRTSDLYSFVSARKVDLAVANQTVYLPVETP